jgi:predicted pyridoxine 5'-phosphate oxidase superfamily flavin-nucleotide-binding protein
VALPREPADPADSGLADGTAVALLGIELHTRRRNRLNGTIARTGPDGFTVVVEQAFGNCAKYIQRRDFTFVRDPNAPSGAPPVTLRGLDGAARATIEQADTFFVASYIEGPDGRRQVDVSHRGGRPGFVRVGGGRPADDGQAENGRTGNGHMKNEQAETGDVLTIPDFAGNQFFNTLGNITVNPKAGLVFVDFANGDLLQMTGDAEVLPDSADIAAFEGAQRLWRFRPRRIVRRPAALPLRWTFADP